jgi:hypothetical protein
MSLFTVSSFMGLFTLPRLLAVSSPALLVCSMVTAVRARSTQGKPEQRMQNQRKWSTISLSIVTFDYLLKYGIAPSAANLTGILSFLIVTGRSAIVWGLNFKDDDSRFRKYLQRGISCVTFALCAGLTYRSQIVLKGSFDPYTSLPIAGIAFASVADCCNNIVPRRRNHLCMAAFQFAFGAYTWSSSLLGKAGVDIGACIFFDPWFGDDRRMRVKAAFARLTMRGPERSGHAAGGAR